MVLQDGYHPQELLTHVLKIERIFWSVWFSDVGGDPLSEVSIYIVKSLYGKRCRSMRGI